MLVLTPLRAFSRPVRSYQGFTISRGQRRSSHASSPQRTRDHQTQAWCAWRKGVYSAEETEVAMPYNRVQFSGVALSSPRGSLQTCPVPGVHSTLRSISSICRSPIGKSGPASLPLGGANCTKAAILGNIPKTGIL